MSTTKERIEKWNKNFKSYNAFDEDLNTWLVMGNTYAIKDELKKKGAKFSRELGWLPKTKFEDGIIKTIDWYLANPEWLK